MHGTLYLRLWLTLAMVGRPILLEQAPYPNNLQREFLSFSLSHFHRCLRTILFYLSFIVFGEDHLWWVYLDVVLYKFNSCPFHLNTFPVVCCSFFLSRATILSWVEQQTVRSGSTTSTCVRSCTSSDVTQVESSVWPSFRTNRISSGVRQRMERLCERKLDGRSCRNLLIISTFAPCCLFNSIQDLGLQNPDGAGW